MAETNWHSIDSIDVIKSLNSDPDKGLSNSEATNRISKFGKNSLTEGKKITLWSIAKHEVTEPMILLLLVVGIIYSIWGEVSDAITIFVVIFLLVLIEVIVEFRAKSSIAALKKLSEPTITVIRDGKQDDIQITELVPGDIILLQTGNRVPADLRIIESYGMTTDESSLTGESASVEKQEKKVNDSTVLADRSSMLYSSTIITRGRAKAIVVETAMRTELGKVTGMVLQAKIEKTPLQKVAKELTKWMVWVALAFSILIPVIGVLQGQPLKLMILTGLALSFATIPEELPIVITMVLALGAYSLSKKNALVKNLDSAETLGSVTVICTDKTGTLTENKMTISKSYINKKTAEYDIKTSKELLEAAVLVNDVVIRNDSFVGDPMQVALLNSAINSGVDISEVKAKYGKQIQEFSFDSIRKMMSSVYLKGKDRYVFVTGAPEMLLKKCNRIRLNGKDSPLTEKERKKILSEVNIMSNSALRVIAFAGKKTKDKDISQKDAESSLVFIGMFGLIDPPRPDVISAVKECQEAGIRIIMITGDHISTAKAIAEQVGIDGGPAISGAELDSLTDTQLQEKLRTASIFARVTPAHKLRIVNALKANGAIVAVTGDGINDAPALSNAHIGIAMGAKGTDVAKEAAGMVLTDDNFSTIAKAVREGRKIFDNMKKGIRYYLSCKLALILIFLLPILLGIALPFAPVQIIILELFMDVAASSAFAVEDAESDIMKKKPRDPKAKFLDSSMLSTIFISSTCLVMAVLFTYFWSISSGADLLRAQTIAFATWIVGHVFLAINMRSDRDPLHKIGLFSNKVIVLWGIAAVFALILTIDLPVLGSVIKTTHLSGVHWLVIVGVAFISTFWMEAVKIMSRTTR